MKEKNLRSEAAVRRAIKYADRKPVRTWIERVLADSGKTVDILISVEAYEPTWATLCEISLKDHIKKRKPLTGATKKFKEIVRGTKAKKRKK